MSGPALFPRLDAPDWSRRRAAFAVYKAEDNTVNARDGEVLCVARLKRMPSRIAEALHRMLVPVFQSFSLKKQTALLNIASDRVGRYRNRRLLTRCLTGAGKCVVLHRVSPRLLVPVQQTESKVVEVKVAVALRE